MPIHSQRSGNKAETKYKEAGEAKGFSRAKQDGTYMPGGNIIEGGFDADDECNHVQPTARRQCDSYDIVSMATTTMELLGQVF